MKNLITTAFVFVILGGTTELMAQSASDLPMHTAPYNFTGQSVMAYDNRYEGVKGTNTFLEEFSPGTIELKKGKFSNVLINYDAYTDNLLAINDKLKDTVQMRKDMIVNFAISNTGGEKFAFTKQSLNGASIFLLELVRDTTSLFCRISKTIKKAEIGGAYRIDQNNHDEFVTSNTYYVTKGTNGLQELQKNKKAVLKMFPEFKDQLSVYLKQNKVDYKDQEDMKRMIQYINTLRG